MVSKLNYTVRVGICNDVVMAAEVLRRVVNSMSGFEVSWVAYDGAEAVHKAAEITPDIILMDLIMPGMSGAEACYHIMKSSPCAILIVTASVSGNISQVFEAMGYGALDVTRMPSIGSMSAPEGAKELIHKMEMIRRLIGKEPNDQFHFRHETEVTPAKHLVDGAPILIVLGASTGGPLALSRVLSDLPSDLPAAIVIIQHIDGPFAENLASWLGDQCALPVKVALEGETLQCGTVFIAGTDDHLVLDRELKLRYSVEPQNAPYRPSVDVFLHSLAEYWPHRGVAALLTGMGRDGATGLRALRNKGWHTIAEHKDTCVVFGMPKAAIELGGISEVLPIQDIGVAIFKAVKQQNIHAGKGV